MNYPAASSGVSSKAWNAPRGGEYNPTVISRRNNAGYNLSKTIASNAPGSSYFQTSLRKAILAPDFWTLFYLMGESPTSIWSNFPLGVITLS